MSRNAGGHANVVEIGGWAGLATAVVAWYASLATVIDATFGRTMLSVTPLTK